MNELLKEYKEYLELLNKSDETIKSYLSTMNKLCRDQDFVETDDFINLDMSWWLSYIEEQKEATKPSTINKKIKQVSTFYNFLIISKRMNIINYCKQMPNINETNNSEFKEKVLNDMQIKSIIGITYNREFNLINKNHNKYSNLRDKLIIYILFDLGMRIEEISRIEINDINFEDNKIMIRGKGFGGNISRFNYFNDKTKSLMLELISMNPNRKYLLETYNNKQLGTQSIRKIWYKVCELADIKGYTPHNVRHSVASRMINEGVKIEKIAQFLGHKGDATAKKYYIKATDDLKDSKKVNDSLFM